MPGPLHPRVSLSVYADGRLPLVRRKFLERHLRHCTRCAIEVEQIRAMGVLLRRPEVEIPPALQKRLIDLSPPTPPPKVTAAGGAQVPRRTVGVGGLAVAGLVLLAAIGAGAVSPGSALSLPPAARASISDALPGMLPSDWGVPVGWRTDPGDAVIVPAVDNVRSP